MKKSQMNQKETLGADAFKKMHGCMGWMDGRTDARRHGVDGWMDACMGWMRACMSRMHACMNAWGGCMRAWTYACMHPLSQESLVERKVRKRGEQADAMSEEQRGAKQMGRGKGTATW